MTSVRLILLPLAFAVILSLSVQADERGQNKKVKNEKNDVTKAQNEIKEDAKDLSVAQQKLRQAQGRENEARHHLEVTRKRVEAEHKSSLAFDAALAEQAQTKQALDDAKAPILQALKSTPAYKAAQDRIAAARARSKSLRDDSSLPEEAQKKALAETAREGLAVRDLEQSAIDAEPKLKPLHDELASAQANVARLHSMVKEAVEADSEVGAGRRALQNAMQQTAQAKAEVAKENHELAGDQAKLANQQGQLEKAKLNDAMRVNAPRGRRARPKK